MDIDKETTIAITNIDEDVFYLLQSIVYQNNFISTESKGDTVKSSPDKVLKRSKRELSKFDKLQCKVGQYARAGLSMADGIPILNAFTGFLKGISEINDIRLGCEDIPFVEVKEVLGDGFSKVGSHLDDVSKGIANLQKAVAKNYWGILENHAAILGNRGILLGNRALLVANQALMLVNTGLLIGLGFMMMGISSKLDRNYEAIKQVEAKVDRNFEALRVIDSKVDRNLKVMLASFQVLEKKLESGFRMVTDLVRETRIEGVTSELITFMKYFVKVRHDVENFTREQYIRRVDELTEILERLQNSRLPHTGTLHTLLYNIINQRLAIPASSHDAVAITALGLLCSGTEVYVAVMTLLFEEYSNLAKLYYRKGDLEKYNQYVSVGTTIFDDFRSILTKRDGLIDEVVAILNEIKSYDFIINEREDVVKFAVAKIDDLGAVKPKLSSMFNLSREKSNEKIKFDFSHSHTKTPIGNWEDRRKVAYAIQFQSNGTYYVVGDWSTASRVYKKANPLLDIGVDPKGRTRLLFRKFDDDNPQLVGVIEDSNQKEFRDISRDLYDSALEPNEEVAINDMKEFLKNGADVHAKFEKGRQAIHAAAENGNKNVAYVLIDAGANVNAEDINGYTPLHISAEEGLEEFVKYLKYIGGNINAKTNLGMTALHLASERGHLNTVKSLLEMKGIKVNSMDERGYTPLHSAVSFGRLEVITTLCGDKRVDVNKQSKVKFAPLHLAVIGEFKNAVESLLTKKEIDVNTKTVGGLTPLHYAALIGNLDITNSILKHNSSNLNVRTDDGWTPLHLAINSQQDNLALELLSKNQTGIFLKGKDDLTPLHLAASKGQKNILNHLLNKGAELEANDVYGCTPLHLAVENGNLDVIDLLVMKGANLDAERTDGFFPASLAAANGQMDVIRYFVENKKVNIDAKNKNGMTLIDFAAKSGHFDIVEFLLDKKSNREHALHWAAFGGNFGITKLLSNQKNTSFTTKDMFGNIPLHIAAWQGHLDMVKYFIDDKNVYYNVGNNEGYSPFLFSVLGDHLSTVKYFIEDKNVTLDTYDSDGSGATALHLAALHGNLGMVKYLVKKEADVEAEDEYGNTPLFFASSRGHLGIFSYLVQKGAAVDAVNIYGNTPLHFASWNGHLDIVKIITEKKGALNVKNRIGSTPLLMASSVDITQYLIEKGSNRRAINYNGSSLLHLASSSGNVDIVKYLILEKEADLNSKDRNGNIALHVAAENGHLNVVKYIVEERRAAVNRKNNDGNTALHLAVLENHTETINYLIDEESSNLNIRNKEGNTALHLAVAKGDLAVVHHFVNDGSNFHLKDRNNCTLLHLAAFHGYLDIVEYFMHNEMFGLGIEDSFGNSPLLKAGINNKWEVVKYLLSEGADIGTTNKVGWTLVHASAYYNRPDILMLLFGDSDVGGKFKVLTNVHLNAVDNSKKTPLHVAVEQGSFDVLKYLINKGADTGMEDEHGRKPFQKRDISNDQGFTPLHYAAKKGDLEVFKLIVDKGSDFKAEDTTPERKQPIHVAAIEGHLAILEFLIEKRVNADTSDKMGWTPLHYAAKNGRLNLVKFLLSKNASMNVKEAINNRTPKNIAAEEGKLDVYKFLDENGAITSIDKNGYIGMHLAAQNGHLDIIKYISGRKGEDVLEYHVQTFPYLKLIHLAAQNGHLDVFRYLSENKIDPFTSDNYGRTTLHFASSAGYLDIVQYILEHKPNVNVQDQYFGKTPLHCASEGGHYDVVKYLIDKNATVNAIADYTGDFNHRNHETPLYLASEKNRLRVVRYLIAKGAEIDLFTYAYKPEIRRYTPLKIASKFDHLEVVKHLAKKGAHIGEFDTQSYSYSPLEEASRSGYLKVPRYLLEKGADFSDMGREREVPHNVRALIQKFKLNFSLLNSVSYGNISEVEKFVNEGANLYSKTKDGLSIFDLVPYKSDILSFLRNVSRLQLELFSSVEQDNVPGVVNRDVSLEIKTINEETPLFVAAHHNNLKTMKYLLDQGAYVNATDIYGWTPLHIAAHLGNLETVKNLVQCWPCLTIETDDGKTPVKLTTSYKVKREIEHARLKANLNSAIKKGDLNAVEMYVTEGADTDFITRDQYIDSETLEFVDIKYPNIKAFITTQRQLNTNLSTAAGEGNMGEVRKCVTGGANIETKIVKGETPILIAAKNGKLDVVRYLADNGADVDFRNTAYSVLHYVYMYGDLDAIDFLITKGVDLEARDFKGCTILHEAVIRNNLERVNFLLQRGGDVNSLNNKSIPPLHTAAYNGYYEVVKCLVENGADIELQNSDGYTPLHISASFGYLDLVKYLVESGSNLTAVTSLNKNALDLSRECNATEVINFLTSAEQRPRHKHQEQLQVGPNNNDSLSLNYEDLEDVASAASKTCSWINTLATSFIAGALKVPYLLRWPFTAPTLGSSGFESTFGQSQKIKNPGKEYAAKFCGELCLQSNANLTFLVLQSFLDKKYPIPKYHVTNSETPTALGIVECFETILKESAKELEVPLTDFNYFELYLSLIDHLRFERYSQLSEALYSAAEATSGGNKEFLNTVKLNIEKMFVEKHK